MKITSNELINELKNHTHTVIEAIHKYESLPVDQLNDRIDENSWSILECIEHLNRYGDFYIPEIKARIQTGKTPARQEFKSGWLGNYFAKSMLPQEKLNKMKTFKSMNPKGSELNKSTLEKFKMQQKEILSLLDKSMSVDLAHTKTSISLSKHIKLRLGDTLRVVIYHNLRHILQANRVLAHIAPS